MSRFYRHTGLHPLARLKAWHRTLVAILIGLLVMAWMPQGLWETRLLAAWLAASAIYQITLCVPSRAIIFPSVAGRCLKPVCFFLPF